MVQTFSVLNDEFMFCICIFPQLALKITSYSLTNDERFETEKKRPRRQLCELDAVFKDWMMTHVRQ